MVNISWVTTLALTLLALSGAPTIAQDKEEPKAKDAFVIRLVDGDGKPITRAYVGTSSYFGATGDNLPPCDSTGWRYSRGARSDEDGIVRFSAGREFLGNVCVVARHPERKLVAIATLTPDTVDASRATEAATLTMQPECRVSGRLTSSELARRDRDAGWTNVYLSHKGRSALSCQSERQSYHFFVPPGDFSLNAYGQQLHAVQRTFTVKPGDRELVLNDIDLPPTRLALLQGTPAPELVKIIAWKNSSPIALAELKGKCVILDFWGYWCGPCVVGMPDLFKLYDKYRDRGLEIIGVHVDLGENETEHVDSVARLDDRLSKVRKTIWGGRDVPYPVAIVTGERVSFGDNTGDRMALSPVAAAYGIKSYPTLVLIDRDGKVVDEFFPEETSQIERLERMLDEK